MRIIFVILDGAADSGNITPLKAAKIESLNFLAKNGKTGLIFSVKKGIAPESDIGVLSLLGYNPYKYYTGRGPLEMHGCNIKLNKFLAFRANFATAINRNIIDRRAGRNLTTKEAISLANSVNKKVKLNHKFIFKPTTEHRAILVFKSNLPSNVTNTDIGYKKKGIFSTPENITNNEFKFSKPLSKSAKITSSLINEFTLKSREILKNHSVNKGRLKRGLLPANIILLRDPGNKLPRLPKKKNWISISSMPLEIGISRLAGLRVIKAKLDKNGNPYKNITNICNLALKSIKKYKNSNVYVHFKETDIPGHDGDFNEKVKLLEYIDKKFFSEIKSIKNTIIVVTSDHATPVSLKSHSADPVPILIYGNGKDKVRAFNETDCKKGSIKLTKGYKLMELIQNI